MGSTWGQGPLGLFAETKDSSMLLPNWCELRTFWKTSKSSRERKTNTIKEYLWIHAIIVHGVSNSIAECPCKKEFMSRGRLVFLSRLSISNPEYWLTLRGGFLCFGWNLNLSWLKTAFRDGNIYFWFDALFFTNDQISSFLCSKGQSAVNIFMKGSWQVWEFSRELWLWVEELPGVAFGSKWKVKVWIFF